MLHAESLKRAVIDRFTNHPIRPHSPYYFSQALHGLVLPQIPHTCNPAASKFLVLQNHLPVPHASPTSSSETENVRNRIWGHRGDRSPTWEAAQGICYSQQ